MDRGLLLAACLLVSGPLVAGDVPLQTDAQAIVAQQLELKAAVEAGSGTFEHLPEAKRADVLARQGRVLAMLEGRKQTSELSQQQQLSLFNELEAIRSIAEHAEDERLICERVKPVGSNRPVRVCKTVSERRAEQGGYEPPLTSRN
ncbi:hypothetical protein [Luteimonas saliphila]|uniref:hypothetical protein n=1 Tax=Luteimonas saliphila TaxID=2804919 RepID=UPI00192D2BE1|nr:hypothetical protein [Luteimonas saliphila]